MRKLVVVIGLLAFAYAAAPTFARTTQASSHTAASGAGQVLFGSQTVQKTQDGGKGTSEAFGYTATTSGTATNAEVYLDTTDGVSLGLYSDQSGRPGARLDQGTVTTNTKGWVSVLLNGGAAITAGHRYWIAVAATSSKASVGYRDGGASGSNLDYAGRGLKNPYSTSQQWNSNPVSAYVDGAKAGSSQTSPPPSAPPAPTPPPPTSSPVAPTNTSGPTVSGTAEVGDTLTAQTGSWAGDRPMTYTYQWSDGATGSTDTLSGSDQGKSVSVTVTATNDGGVGSASSQSVGPVVADPPPPPPPPSGNPPSGGSSCLADPSSCGYPDATNSGLAGCPALKSTSGFTASTNGATYSDMSISGTVTVQANNVTFNCVKIADNNPTKDTGFVLNLANGNNTVVQHSEIDGNSGNQNACIQGASYTLNFVNVSGCQDTVHAGWNVTITNSYLHDNTTADPAPHADGIQWIGCATCGAPSNWNDLVQHNTIYPGPGNANPYTNSAIFIKSDQGPINGVTVDNNLLDGGAYVAYDIAGSGGYPTPTNITFTNNRFGVRYHFGLADFASNPAPAWSGNTWDAKGSAISSP